jgi:predicted nucleotidyltransferase component of viral defense system
VNFDTPYRAQVALLVRVLPHVAAETCFALKGGTAINLFIRDMPRLSVDIDLTYLPRVERRTALQEISGGLAGIRERILKNLPGSQVYSKPLAEAEHIVKLIVRMAGAQIKIEVTPVLRGTVFATEERQVSERVEAEFGYARMQVVSFADLYAGKIVAALDRQHPRDLFDVRLLLAKEGLSRSLFQAFLIYLASHNRAMAEILAPLRRDIRDEFERGFLGMTTEPVTLADLEASRESLIGNLRDAFTQDDKRFLLSIKNGTPDWNLLEIPAVEDLPALRWKLKNLAALDTQRRAELVNRLEEVLKGYGGELPFTRRDD